MKQLHSFHLFFAISALILSGCAANPGTTPLEKPNVLFIFVDDLRPQLGCYGHDFMKTPHLDRLAAEGTLFLNHFAQVPTCGASRFSMLTGKYPVKPVHLLNQAIVNELSDRPEGRMPESFIHHLKRNGYYTVGIGKISHSADGYVYGYEEPVSDKRELPYSWDELHFNTGKWGTGWNAFFGYADGSNRQSRNFQVKPYECGEVDDEGYPDGLTASLAIEKLRELKGKEEHLPGGRQAFFLGVGFFKPHLPFTAPEKYWDMYDEASLPLSPNPDVPENVTEVSLHNSGEFNSYQKGEEKAAAGKRVSDGYARKLRHANFAVVSYVDAQIGRLLDEIERLELQKNTIVVVWGDHGWHLGDQTIWGKHTVFERALRSALIIRVPGAGGAGQKVNGLVESIDLYPTLCELCGIEPPDSLDGVSLLPLLNNPKGDGKEAVYGFWNNGTTVRTVGYRLSRFYNNGNELFELYDHQNDPLESVNVATTQAEVVEELKPLLKTIN